MDSATNAVLTFVNRCVQAGQECWLITVVKTWGSSPRLPGACFAWCKSQGACGSLSGGCIEEDLIEKLSSGFFNNQDKPFLESYGITPETAQQFGLPCGGKLDILIERILPNKSQQQHFAKICNALNKRQGYLRTVSFNTPFSNEDYASLAPSNPQPLTQDQNQISFYLGPKYRLLIIGANQVAQYLAEFTSALDFEIWICDPRPNAFQNWPLEFTLNFSQMPDDLIREQANDKFTAIVTLSHDPRVDDMALMEALTTNAFYVGAMGSKRTTAARLERLKQLDLSQSQINKLRAPIGLPIGSKTPAEIAISITGDLINTIRNHH